LSFEEKAITERAKRARIDFQSLPGRILLHDAFVSAREITVHRETPPLNRGMDDEQ